MTKTTELEARIRVLEDIEAIKKLKAKYWRCCDQKDWNGLADCFVEDAVGEYGGPDNRFTSAEAIMKWVKDTIGRDSICTVHQGHNAEIDLTGERTAKGVWEMYYYMVDSEAHLALTMGCFYEDEYAKEKGGWKIRSTKTIPIYMETAEKTS